jgi:hypothetical protein
MRQYFKYLNKLHEYLFIEEEDRFWDGSIDKLKKYLEYVSN